MSVCECGGVCERVCVSVGGGRVCACGCVSVGGWENVCMRVCE